MRLLPEGIDEMSVNFRWGVEWRLRMIEDVVCAPQGSRPGGPGMEESMERARRAAQRGDREVEDAAFLAAMRAEVREGWRDFPERQLLGDLFRRAALRTKSRPRNSIARHNGRRPTHEEGLRVAKALVADIAAAARFDFAWESGAVSIVLADQWVSRDGKGRQAELRVYIDYANSSPVYFDALPGIQKRLQSRGESIPRPLARRRAEVARGSLQRPARNPVPPHRPAKPEQLLRDVKIRFAIEVLRSVGVPPMGAPVSGCGFVAEALEIPEDTVTRIWKRPFEVMMRQHMKATAERNGPFHTH